MYCLRSLQVIKPYNSLEAQGNAILQVCYTPFYFSFVFLRVQRALDASYHAQLLHVLLLKQEIKKTKAALLDDTYFCHCQLNIKKELIITNK